MAIFAPLSYNVPHKTLLTRHSSTPVPVAASQPMTRQPLHICLFETLHISHNTIDRIDLGSPKAQSLLAYLILNHHQTLDRRRLAFIFWPRGTETAARRNLRQYLHRVRRALEPLDPHGELLTTAGHHIAFAPPEDWPWTLDTDQFETACRKGTPTDLATAVSLYRGDLLADIYDDWVTPERERLAALYRESLIALVDHQSTHGHLPEAIRYAQDYVTAEPLLETGYLRLMKLYHQQGDRGRVKQIYDQLVAVLAEDLDAAPLPETTAVYEAIMDGR
ncbi:MAG: winged helix-turn-helix domain-containing protein, partial [Anaerolineales bacterium]|nr:winged helix-turn-helix domain-containing protein [Anaerolineales bacterium]